jgi:hypothetical protein
MRRWLVLQARDPRLPAGRPPTHITISDLALAQIPGSERYGQPILIRADGAGATKAWLTTCTNCGSSTAWTWTTRSGSR